MLFNLCSRKKNKSNKVPKNVSEKIHNYLKHSKKDIDNEKSTNQVPKSKKTTSEEDIINLNSLRKAYLHPNEEHPKKSKEIFKRAPKGAYIGVGTERCMFVPYLSNNITHVIMADHDKRVNLYNKINVSLVTASTSRNMYNHLRFSQSFDEFKLHLKECNYSPKGSDINLYDSKNYKWFNAAINKKAFHKYYSGINNFSEVSYLFNDIAYEKVKAFADNDRFIIKNFEISNNDHISDIKKTLESRNVKISLYDPSNAWWTRYVPLDKSPDRSFILGPDCFEKDGLVMVTDRYHSKPWFYMGFKREDLKNNPSVTKKIFVDVENKVDFTIFGEAFGKDNLNKVVDINVYKDKILKLDTTKFNFDETKIDYNKLNRRRKRNK